MSSSEKSTGIVKWFNNAKGYGFILNQQNEDVFVHYRSILTEGCKSLSEGQRVDYLHTRSEKGWQADKVVVV